MAGPQIGLTSLGAAEAWLLQALVATLETAFGATVEMVDPLPLPHKAYNASRNQHRSAVLLDVLAKHTQSDWERLLGITDVDLYTPDLNFVFGQADAKRGLLSLPCLVSVWLTATGSSTAQRPRPFTNSPIPMG